MRFFLLTCLLAGMLPVAAQDYEISCGGDAANVSKDAYAQRTATFQERYLRNWQEMQSEALNSPRVSAKANATYVIPVVVHIIHSCQPMGSLNSNPDDAYVKGVLQETNLRFRQQQANAPTFSNPLYGPDTEIELCLATVDPDGNYTTGIVRHPDAALASSDNWIQQISDLDGIYGWPNTDYVNIYLVEETNTSGGAFGPKILMKTSSFWSGLTAHEMGHVFGLGHTFGDNNGDCSNDDCTTDGDGVCDTPAKGIAGTIAGNCTTPGNSCATDEDDPRPINPYRSMADGGVGEQPDMLANYMDYTGGCWDAFSVGQKALMHTTLQESFWASNLAAAATLCASPTLPNKQVAIDASQFMLDNCSGTLALGITLRNGGATAVSSLNFSLSINGAIQNLSWSGSLAPGATTTYNNTLPFTGTGNFAITLAISQVDNLPDAYPNDSDICANLTVLGTGDYPYAEDFASCGPVPSLSFSSTGSRQMAVTTFLPGDLPSCLDCHLRYVGYSSNVETVEVCLPASEIASLVEPELRFSYGHIPRYNFISNTLSVVYAPCGGAEQTLWNRSGLALGTNTPPQYVDNGGGGESPSCSEIEDVIVDLSGLPQEGQICLRLLGRYYSPLLLDNLLFFDARALPAELSELSASSAGKINLLRWTTAREESLGHFVVERSLDAGQSFQPIGQLPATNLTTSTDYTFQDEDRRLAEIQRVYYRLRAVDQDGSEQLHGPVSVVRTIGKELAAWPNPVKAGQQLLLTTSVEGIQLFHASGQLLLERAATTNLVLPMGLPTGIYYLHLFGEEPGSSKVQKLIVL